MIWYVRRVSQLRKRPHAPSNGCQGKNRKEASKKPARASKSGRRPMKAHALKKSSWRNLRPARSQEVSKRPGRSQQEASNKPGKNQQEASKRPARGQQEASKRPARGQQRGQQEASKRPARGQQEARKRPARGQQERVRKKPGRGKQKARKKPQMEGTPQITETIEKQAFS